MLIVDRLEGEWAVIEWEEGTFNFPRKLLPAGVREGDVLTMTLERDEELTVQRQKAAQSELDDLLGGKEEEAGWILS
ncbi:MAG: hypothetical protein PWP58_358 [Bacillota bacterium]|jgi:hypothetical protein|nr:hypothetical protein [Bacillota bacterium]